MIHYSDEKIINDIRENREGSISYLYKEFFTLIRSIVVKNSGNNEDAEDVFQDGLIVLFQKIRLEPFELNCSLKTFFFAVCRNIWLQRLDRKWRLHYQADFVKESANMYDPNLSGIDEEYLEKTRLCQTHILALPEDCQKILMMSFAKHSLSEIAESLGFKNASYAKTRKYLCKNMLRKRILNDPEYKTFFKYD
jgi:RNA polymerase sigma factor (sigma-70 family)